MIPDAVMKIFSRPFEIPPFIERFGTIYEDREGDLIMQGFVVNGIRRQGHVMTMFEARKLVILAVICRLQEELDRMEGE